MDEVWRVAIIAVLSTDLVLLFWAWIKHRNWWTPNDVNVWWILFGWSLVGLVFTADNLIHDKPVPGWRTMSVLGLSLITASVALRILREPGRVGPCRS